MDGKIIIFSAPSGCGKSTIINKLMPEKDLNLAFSVSATNREPRAGEKDGINYHFITTEEFKQHIASGDFVEYEEVYPGRYYGTLCSEIENKCKVGCNVVLDIDVKGGMRVKEIFGDKAISIFIQPPSIEELRRRLEGRATDSADVINQRVDKAEYELTFAPYYDCRIMNDELETAVESAKTVVSKFVK